MHALACLVLKSEYFEQLPAFAAAGGIPAAMSLLQGSENMASKLAAARLLAMVCTFLPDWREAVRATGGVQAMQRLLQSCDDADVQETAGMALDCLTGDG